MRFASLLTGLMVLLAFSGCASEDSPDDTTAAPEAVSTAEPEEEAGSGAPSCESSRPGTDIPSPGACAAFALGDTRLDVDYGSPSVREREIFGGLVPYGEVWRTGANEATTFSTSGDLLVNGDSLAAGTYGLFTVPGESEWTVIFNSVADQWGAFDYDDSADALRVTAAPETTDATLERFTISFEEGTNGGAVMVLAWDDVRVPVSISSGA